MTDTAVIDIALQAMLVALKLSAPILVTALVIGFVVSLFQSVTQIQEVTLSFVPKVIGVGVALLLVRQLDAAHPGHLHQRAVRRASRRCSAEARAPSMTLTVSGEPLVALPARLGADRRLAGRSRRRSPGRTVPTDGEGGARARARASPSLPTATSIPLDTVGLLLNVAHPGADRRGAGLRHLPAASPRSPRPAA